MCVYFKQKNPINVCVRVRIILKAEDRKLWIGARKGRRQAQYFTKTIAIQMAAVLPSH